MAINLKELASAARSSTIRELLFERCGIVLPKLEERHKAIALEIINKVELEKDLLSNRAIRLLLATENDCLVVTSHRPTHYGYHEVRIGGERVRLHRFVYIHFVEMISDDLLVRHLCNNRGCVNPTHLAKGTHQDNYNDKVLSGTNIRPDRGLENSKAKLTKAAIQDILTARMSHRAFGKLYGVNHNTIGSVLRGKSYLLEVEQCLST